MSIDVADCGQLALLAGVFEHSVSAVMISDASLRIVKINQAFLDLGGYEAADVIGQPVRFEIDPSMPADKIAAMIEAIATLGRWEGEQIGRRKDGSSYPRWTSVVRVQDEHGGFSHSISSSIDLTGMRQVEADLLKTEQRMQLMVAVFENSREAFLVTEAATNTVVAINAAFTRVTGYAADEIVGRKVPRLAAEPNFEVLVAQRLQALEERGYWEGEGVSLRKDGTTFPRWQVMSAIRNEQGRVTHRVSSFNDITSAKATEDRLRLFARIFDHTAEALMLIGLDRRIVMVNSAFTRMTGYTQEGMAGRNPSLLSGDGAEHRDIDDVAGDRGKVWEGEIACRRKDGSVFPRWMVVSPIRDDEGNLTHYIGAFQDITRRKQEAAHMTMLADVFEHAAMPIIVSDPEGNVMVANPAYLAATGYAAEEVVGRSGRMLLASQSGQDAAGEMMRTLDRDGTWQGEIERRRRDGTTYPSWTSVSRVRDAQGALLYTISSSLDMSAIKHAERRVEHLAHHDALTGLPNRVGLQGRLEQTLAQARRDDDKVAVIMIDLDRFKIINDTLGHAVGDGLLREVSKRLLASVRQTDSVARLGGDEFVVVLSDVNSQEMAAQKAQRILAEIGAAYEINGHELISTPSLGICMFPADGADVDTLIKNADAAMYHAKAEGRNQIQFFVAKMNEAVSERMTLERDLRGAVARGELILHYQPQVEMSSNKPIGFEALVRWQHPVHGMVSPAKFIPLAEEIGVIVEIGEWVLREALRQLREWRNVGLPVRRIAVNLSAAQLRVADFEQVVARAIAEHGLHPSDLELEITESMAMQDPEETIRILNNLRAMGVELAMDDFGTGYSSLSYLKLLPIQRLKLDQSFVRDIETDASDAAICAGTIALAHQLGHEVVAEGAETAGQVEHLKRIGGDVIQGYYYSKPLPADAATRFFAAAHDADANDGLAYVA